MADFPAPVANQFKTPDPNQSLGTLSSILGIQQQKQALQTGAYQQQTVQADSQQAQQKNNELQKVGALMQSVHSGAYRKADGTLDQQKFADDVQLAAPVYGQQVAASARSQANEIVANQKAKQELTDTARGSLGATLTALAKDPNTRRDDVVSAYTQWLQDHKDDPAAFRVGIAQATMLPQNDADPNYRAILGKYAATLTGQPTTAPSTIETAGQIQPGQTSNVTGAFSPAGAPIEKPPTQTTNAAGQILNRSPQTGALAAPPASSSAGEAPPGGVNPTTAQAQTQNTIAAGVTQRVQQAQAAANNTTQAQDALTRARAILDKPDAINTGAGFEWKKSVRNVLASAGIATGEADDANTLVKNLSRYEAARATQAGLGGTDAARELAHNGSPNVALSTDALKGVVTQSLATEKALAAYAGIQAKTQDPAVLQKNEAEFRSIPNLIEGYEYGLARNKGEAEEFLTKHGLNEKQMKETRARIKEFESR